MNTPIMDSMTEVFKGWGLAAPHRHNMSILDHIISIIIAVVVYRAGRIMCVNIGIGPVAMRVGPA